MKGESKMTMFEWYFTATDGGLNYRSGDTYKTESQAVWHGKRWVKETGRKGTVTAIKAERKTGSYILDY
jgi:hypothetical protein